jgi:hypothetical protein
MTTRVGLPVGILLVSILLADLGAVVEKVVSHYPVICRA